MTQARTQARTRARTRARRWRVGASMVAIAACGLVGGCSSTPPVHRSTPTSPVTSSPPPTLAADAGPCAFKPSATTTGASGSRIDQNVRKLTAGQRLTNANVGHLVIAGAHVVVQNVQVNGSILVLGDDALIDHVTADGVEVSSASGTTVQYTNIGFGSGDGIHITSDRGRLVHNVTLAYNYVHDPKVPDNAHYDGTQVRGINGLRIFCSVYDPGAYQHMYNAAVYLEDANGGDSNVVVERNWLYGFGFSLMLDATNATVADNRVGGDVRWANCRLGSKSGNVGLRVSGNVEDASGQPMKACKAPRQRQEASAR